MKKTTIFLEIIIQSNAMNENFTWPFKYWPNTVGQVNVKYIMEITKG